jgi:hypothetical protein
MFALIERRIRFLLGAVDVHDSIALVEPNSCEWGDERPFRLLVSFDYESVFCMWSLSVSDSLPSTVLWLVVCVGSGGISRIAEHSRVACVGNT